MLPNPIGGHDYCSLASADPDPVTAGAEVAGALIEAMDQAPSLVVMVVSGRHRSQWDELSELMVELVQPDRLVCIEVDRFFTGWLPNPTDSVGVWATRWPCGLEPLALGSEEALRALSSGTGRSGLVLATTEGAVARSMEAAGVRAQTIAAVSTSAGIGRMTIDGSPARFGITLIDDGRGDVEALGCQGLVPASPVFAVTSADQDRLSSVAGRHVRSVIDEVLVAEDAKGNQVSVRDLVVGSVIETASDADEVESLRVHRIIGTATVPGDIALDEPVPVGSLIRFMVDRTEPGRVDEQALHWMEKSRSRSLLALAQADRCLGSDFDGQSGTEGYWDPTGEIAQEVPTLGLMVPRCYGPLGTSGMNRPSGWLHRGVGFVGVK